MCFLGHTVHHHFWWFMSKERKETWRFRTEGIRSKVCQYCWILPLSPPSRQFPSSSPPPSYSPGLPLPQPPVGSPNADL